MGTNIDIFSCFKLIRIENEFIPLLDEKDRGNVRNTCSIRAYDQVIYTIQHAAGSA